MKIFIAGIMQGSIKEHAIQEQNYRQIIGDLIKTYQPEAVIIDPFTIYPDSVSFDERRAKEVLFEMAAEAGSSDILIAYLPEASMGTALEMLRAYDTGSTIISISPMKTNWFIQGVSARVFPTLEDFCDWAHQTQLRDLILTPSK